MSIVSDLMQLFADVPEREIREDIWHDDSWAHWVDALGIPKQAVINDWIGERWDEFMKGFSHAVEVDELLVVHRCITVENPMKFIEDLEAGKKTGKRKGMGIYWTWDFKTAECHWGTGRGLQVILTGLVGIASIDIPQTVLSNFQPSTGEEEKEVRLKEGAPVLITNVSFSETDPRWRFDPPLVRKA